MKTPPPNIKQAKLFQDDLLEHLNPKDPLLLLAAKIPWDVLEKEFEFLYSEMGRPAKPVRLMAGLLILKQLENLSDERVVEAWVRNPYFQAFCGERTFQWSFPCTPSELTHFRKRIGEAGAEKIFQVSVLMHREKVLEKEVLIDSTVQEKNITFPTDSKLQVKVIGRCWKMAATEKIQLRRSYKRELKEIIRTINFSKSPRKNKIVAKAKRRLKTIACSLLREIERKMPIEKSEHYREQWELFNKCLRQERTSKNKIYSLHEPGVLCIAKGKKHKKYEFGSKATVAVTKTSGVIVSAKNFSENLYDGDTLPAVFEQMKRLLNYLPKLAIADRGFRGRKNVAGVVILTPENQGRKISESEKRNNKTRNRRRSAIEPVIGHLKSDFRLARSYLKGAVGDAINLLMAAASFNFKKWMRALPIYFVLLFLAVDQSRKLKQIGAYNPNL